MRITENQARSRDVANCVSKKRRETANVLNKSVEAPWTTQVCAQSAWRVSRRKREGLFQLCALTQRSCAIHKRGAVVAFISPRGPRGRGISGRRKVAEARPSPQIMRRNCEQSAPKFAPKNCARVTAGRLFPRTACLSRRGPCAQVAFAGLQWHRSISFDEPTRRAFRCSVRKGAQVARGANGWRRHRTQLRCEDE